MQHETISIPSLSTHSESDVRQSRNQSREPGLTRVRENRTVPANSRFVTSFGDMLQLPELETMTDGLG